VFQCVAGNVLQCVAVWCSVLRAVMWCRVQCNVLQETRALHGHALPARHFCVFCVSSRVVHCVAVRCSVLQCVAVRCSVLQETSTLHSDTTGTPCLRIVFVYVYACACITSLWYSNLHTQTHRNICDCQVSDACARAHTRTHCGGNVRLALVRM